MQSIAARSTTKLWLGFGLMALACLIWIFGMKFAMVATRSMPVDPDQTMREMTSFMTTMMLSYAFSALVFIGGIVVTIMGLIDYAAAARNRR